MTLDVGQHLLAVQGDAAQVVELHVHPVGYDPALGNLVVGRVGIYLPADALAHLQAQVDGFGHRREHRSPAPAEQVAGLLQREERILNLHQLARSHPAGRDARTDALHVAHRSERLAQLPAQLVVGQQGAHRVETAVDALHILDGKRYPPLEQTSAHGRGRAVDDLGEAGLVVLAVGGKELQVADGELVYPHVFVLVDARNGGDVLHVAMLGELQVVENGPGGRDAAAHALDAESLERACPQLGAELVAVDIQREDPLVELVGVVAASEGLLEPLFAAPLIDNLLGSQVRKQLVDVVVAALGHEELAGRDVEKGRSGVLGTEVDGRQKRVLLIGQYVVVERDARRNQLDDAPLDYLLGGLRVLELLADRHPFAGPHQLGHVDIQCMVGKSGQLHIGGRPVGTPGEGDAQNGARPDGVVAERLVEVPYAKEQYRIGMHRLDGVILLHERRLHVSLFNLFFHDESACRYLV